jgi:hypothetical protein
MGMLKIVVLLLALDGSQITYYQTKADYPSMEACQQEVETDAEAGIYDEMQEEHEADTVVIRCVPAAFDPEAKDA